MCVCVSSNLVIWFWWKFGHYLSVVSDHLSPRDGHAQSSSSSLHSSGTVGPAVVVGEGSSPRSKSTRDTCAVGFSNSPCTVLQVFHIEIKHHISGHEEPSDILRKEVLFSVSRLDLCDEICFW